MLPLGLALCVALLLTANFLVRASRRLIAREQAQMRADVTALSGGVAYARALNVYATLSDAKATLLLGSFLPLVGPVSAEGEAAVAKMKDGVEAFGPFYVEGTLLLVGGLNGQAAIPSWNSDDAFDAQALKPDLNIREKKNSQKAVYYQKTKQGLKTIPSDQVQEESILVRGKRRTVYRDRRSKRFVAKRGQNYEAVAQEQRHSLTVWTLNPGLGGWDDGPPLAQVSKASVSGGKLQAYGSSSFADLFGFGADPSFNTWLSPVDPEGQWQGLEAKLPELVLPRSGIAPIDAWLASSEERYRRYRDLALSAAGEMTH